jgi:hypothetical protein
MPKDCHNSPTMARGIHFKLARCLVLPAEVEEFKV